MRWMIHVGTAPRSAKIGGRRMFRESDVIEWLNDLFESDGSP
jgi:predicted DNA-binding transcriptional regulator AlpA